MFINSARNSNSAFHSNCLSTVSLFSELYKNLCANSEKESERGKCDPLASSARDQRSIPFFFHHHRENSERWKCMYRRANDGARSFTLIRIGMSFIIARRASHCRESELGPSPSLLLPRAHLREYVKLASPFSPEQ